MKVKLEMYKFINLKFSTSFSSSLSLKFLLKQRYLLLYFISRFPLTGLVVIQIGGAPGTTSMLECRILFFDHWLLLVYVVDMRSALVMVVASYSVIRLVIWSSLREQYFLITFTYWSTTVLFLAFWWCLTSALTMTTLRRTLITFRALFNLWIWSSVMTLLVLK